MSIDREQAVAILLSQGVPSALAGPIVEMVETAILTEREACAKVAEACGKADSEEWDRILGTPGALQIVANTIARAIRERRPTPIGD
jgi:hypothetical protein